jgi:ATP-dependent helicase HrpB
VTRLARLPVDEVVPEVRAAIGARGAVVLHAPPGAGKTTRVPPAVAEALGAGAGRVVVLEPRRVAARAAARRIAEERGWTLGREVGWWIRFERRFAPETRVLFVTEGLLVRWLQRDPFLDGVGALVFDEFHERALDSDLALALARRVRREARAELALIAMSATLDVEPLAGYLDAAVVRSEGRLHPVDVRRLERVDERPLEQQVAAAVRRALAETEGDLLAFLPGRAEIARAREALAPLAAERGLELRPLFGERAIEEQDAALRRSDRRRVILATNVAETSVTVEGVRAVVDSGLARQRRYDPATGLDRLETVRISRAAAEQRAGRAGREAPGLCLRLWSAADDLARRPFETPEVRRVDLSRAALELAAWGEREPSRFEWFEPPEPARLERALAELRELGALDAGGVTRLGRRLAALPLAPRLGRLLIEGERLGAREEAALAAALLSDRDPFRGERGTGRAGTRSDLVDRLQALDAARHRPIFDARRQLLSLLRSSAEEQSTARPPAGARNEPEALLRSVAAAYLDRLCRRREPGSERAVMVGGRGVRLARSSAVRDAELFVAVELDAGRAGERSEGLVRVASAVERSWLPPELVRETRELDWDASRERVVERRVERFEDLVLDARETPISDADAAARRLAEQARLAPARALPLDDPALAALRARLRFLRLARPDAGADPSSDEALRALLPQLAAGRRSFAELRRADWTGALLASLAPAERRALESDAPERLEVPSGSRIRIDYSDPARPVLAARIQELFGLAETPRLAAGRVAVLVHLLAPNGRPQQVTTDLASFWKNTYSQVRRELAGRYPKHAWPEDPASARAERRPRSRRTSG